MMRPQYNAISRKKFYFEIGWGNSISFTYNTISWESLSGSLSFLMNSKKHFLCPLWYFLIILDVLFHHQTTEYFLKQQTNLTCFQNLVPKTFISKKLNFGGGRDGGTIHTDKRIESNRCSYGHRGALGSRTDGRTDPLIEMRGRI